VYYRRFVSDGRFKSTSVGFRNGSTAVVVVLSSSAQFDPSSSDGAHGSKEWNSRALDSLILRVFIDCRVSAQTSLGGSICARGFRDAASPLTHPQVISMDGPLAPSADSLPRNPSGLRLTRMARALCTPQHFPPAERQTFSEFLGTALAGRVVGRNGCSREHLAALRSAGLRGSDLKPRWIGGAKRVYGS